MAPVAYAIDCSSLAAGIRCDAMSPRESDMNQGTKVTVRG